MSRHLLQLLLGLLFLAWLPACGDAGSEGPFLLQIEETLSLSSLSDGGEPECNEWSGGEGGPDLLGLLPGVCCSSLLVNGKSIRLSGSFRPRLAEFLSVRHATGPPVA